MCLIADRDRALHYYVAGCAHEESTVCNQDRLANCPLADWDEQYNPIEEAIYDDLPCVKTWPIHVYSAPAMDGMAVCVEHRGRHAWVLLGPLGPDDGFCQEA